MVRKDQCRNIADKQILTILGRQTSIAKPLTPEPLKFPVVSLRKPPVAQMPQRVDKVADLIHEISEVSNTHSGRPISEE